MLRIVGDRPGPRRIALLGFGHVGKALARLLLAKEGVLHDRYGFDWRVTAILTGHHGFGVDEAGLDLVTCLSQPSLPERGLPPPIETLPADVLVEVTPLNASDGQPALDHVQEALMAGMHVVTANKGPIAHAYRELQTLAQSRGRALRFEATVADNLPLFNLARVALPAVEILSLRGILNSTTNYLITQASAGAPLADALAEAQRLGIAERDASNDLEGWDAAVKAVIVNTVLLGGQLRVQDVIREPLTDAVAQRASEAAKVGHRIRMVARIERDAARREPVVLTPEDPLYAVDGFSLGAELSTDVAGRLSLAVHNPHVEQTAYALLADLVDLW
jgi:homoserine dehydrogenase